MVLTSISVSNANIEPLLHYHFGLAYVLMHAFTYQICVHTKKVARAHTHTFLFKKKIIEIFALAKESREWQRIISFSACDTYFRKQRATFTAHIYYESCIKIFITSSQSIEVFKFYKLWHASRRCGFIYIQHASACIFPRRRFFWFLFFIIADFSCTCLSFSLLFFSFVFLLCFTFIWMLCAVPNLKSIAFGTPFNRVHITLSL